MRETFKYAWDVLTTPLRFKEITAPTAAQISADTLALYAKDRTGVSSLYFKDDAGVEHDLGAITSPQALTRVNDTNVTLTLGGTPATALLQAVSLTLGWTGSLAETRGGTAQTTYTKGDTLYSSAANTLAKLAGNTTTTLKVLTQTGDGVNSAAPVWQALSALSGAALTKTDDTNVTLTLGGSPTTALLAAASLTLGWTGTLATGRGGTGTATPTATDWLTQYALLAGRSGGQTLKGDTASGGNLTLNSTAHATKGKILFGANIAFDEANTRLGIGTTSPNVIVEISSTLSVMRMISDNNAASNNSQLQLRSYSGSSANAGGIINTISARGSAASPTATQSGDVLFQLLGDGYTNAITVNSPAQIVAVADGNWGASAAGCYIKFGTTPTTGTTPVEAFRIESSGDISHASGSRFRMLSQNRFRHLNSMVRVTKSGNQSINSGSATSVSWDTEDFDTDGMHDTVTNNSRLTAPIAGKYFVYGIAQWVIDATGSLAKMVGFYFYKNGSLFNLGNFIPDGTGTIGTICTGAVIVNLAANDYMEMYVYQESGSAMNLLGGSVNSSFGMTYIGE